MTERQAQLLRFIESYQLEHRGVSPSFDEMREALGLASKSSVHRMLTLLGEQGRISRRRLSVRAIAVRAGTITVAEFEAIARRLAEQEGAARAIDVLLAMASELMPWCEQEAA
jgi:SOS-response transcriptional repressor LexA